MFSIGSTIVNEFVLLSKKTKHNIILSTLLIDLIGAIALIVLGALSLTGHGGSLITSLNTIPGGGWGMIGGGLITIYALYLLTRQSQYNSKLKLMSQN